MTCDQKLAARIRALLSDRSDAAERPTFANLTLPIAGHTRCGITKDDPIVRPAPADTDAALTSPHARPIDLTGRPLRGFVTVAPGLTGPGLTRLAGQGSPAPKGRT